MNRSILMVGDTLCPLAFCRWTLAVNYVIILMVECAVDIGHVFGLKHMLQQVSGATTVGESTMESTDDVID